MQYHRGPRGETVRVVTWLNEDGEVKVEAFAALGVKDVPHAVAYGRVAELESHGFKPEVHSVVVQ